MPNFKRFDDQDKEYRDTVLPPHLTKRVGIEMASSFGWDRYVGPAGAYITIDRFGASGKGNEVVEAYGFTPEHVATVMEELMKVREGVQA